MHLPIAQSRASPLDMNAYSGIAGMSRGFPIDVLTTRRNVTIIPSGRRAHRITPRLERKICNKLPAIIVIKLWENVIRNMWRCCRPALACYASVSDVHLSNIIETK